ncbi:MAG: PilN domain-containing protein [Pseudomonadota bacterium]
MARINLLPWREWERERRQQEFLVNLVLVLAVAGSAVFAWGWTLDNSITHQGARNNKLNTAIVDLDRQIAEIRNLEKAREDLRSRMQVIQDLQGNRPAIVHVFDELVRTLSSGIHYTEVSMKSSQLTVNGFAESNNRISSLMRNLDGSGWFADPNLKNVKEDPGNPNYGAQASSFDLIFEQTAPNQDEEAE